MNVAPAKVSKDANTVIAAILPRTRKPRSVEKSEANNSRSEVLSKLRETRDAGGFDEVMQLAQALIVCGLPYEPTDQSRIVRKARLADGSQVIVTFSAALDAPMPYGSDRSLLHFILDRAVKSRSRFVSWETASEFLKAMEMTICGKNREDLKKRFKRIRGLAVGVVRVTSGGNKSLLMPVIRRTNLPTSVEERAEEQGQNLLPLSDTLVYGVEIGEDFFNDLIKHHVPVPAVILKATRKQSQMQDLMIFLHWRSYAARGESVIPWKALEEQLWQDDKTARRIKVRFVQAIAALKVIWPELHAEARTEGLWIAPPRNGVYLIPAANGTRRLSKKNTEDESAEAARNRSELADAVAHSKKHLEDQSKRPTHV